MFTTFYFHFILWLRYSNFVLNLNENNNVFILECWIDFNKYVYIDSESCLYVYLLFVSLLNIPGHLINTHVLTVLYELLDFPIARDTKVNNVIRLYTDLI